MRLVALVFVCGLVACDKAEEGHGHGAEHDLGTQTAGPFTVAVKFYGEVEAGEEIALDVWLSDSPRRASSVQARLANDAGDGTVNTMVPRTGGSGFHSHLDVPEGIPEDVALWITVWDGGTQHSARFDLPD